MRWSVLALTLAVAGTVAAWAAPTAPAIRDGNNPGFAARDRVISVSPTVAQVAVDAGDSATVDVQVHNTTARRFAFAIEFRDVAPHSNPRKDKRIADAGSTERGAGDWLSAAPATFELGGGGEQTVRVTAAVPEDAAPGGHFAAVVVSAQAVGAAGGLNITTQLTSLVFLTVRGDVHHELDVRVEPVHRIDLADGLDWDVTIANHGNVHESLDTVLHATGALGASTGVDLPPAIVFPGAERVFRVHASVRNAPNLYRPTVTVQTVGDDGRPHTGDDRRVTGSGGWTLLVPWWALAVVVLAIAVIAVRVRRRRRGQGPDEFDDWQPDDEIE